MKIKKGPGDIPCIHGIHEKDLYYPVSVLFSLFDCLSGGSVTGRGCSTKQRIFSTECENHVMGGKGERFCYCSYGLCNQGMRLAFTEGGAVLLALIVIHKKIKIIV